MNQIIFKILPKVSIGMPVFNGEAFLCEALDSLLAQTFTDFELIISDNGSTDGTEGICRDYAEHDLRIKYVRQPKNQGSSFNFKFVLDKAVGEYFMWAAADDQWSPNWIAHLLGNFKISDFGIFGEYQYIGDSGQIIGSPLVPLNLVKNSQLKTFLLPDTSGKCFYNYSLFLRKSITAVPINNLVEFLGRDQIYIMQFLEYGDLRAIPGAVLKYRVHDDNTSAKESLDMGKYRRMLFSVYPAQYYKMSIKVLPLRLRFIAVGLIPIKYIYEQGRSYLNILTSIIIKIDKMLQNIKHFLL
jgi:glycosyltransferase involved in cell wall biosynthesis